MTERKIVQCRSTFATSDNGNTVMIQGGDLYYSDDPIVKGRESLFSEPTVKSSRPAKSTARAQETATAAPGERRSVARPAKAESKPAAKPAAKSEEDKSDA